MIFLLGALASAAIGATAGVAFANMPQAAKTDATYDQMKASFKKYGLEDVDWTQIINEAYTNGNLSKADKDRFMKVAAYANEIEAYYEDQAHTDGVLDWIGDRFQNVATVFQDKYGKDGEDFFKFMWQNAENYVKDKTHGQITGDSIAQAWMSGSPDYSINSPDYLADPGEYQIKDVEPVKRWTGPELAAFHDIPYDVAEYYDILKEGTAAAVKHAEYQNAQANEASMFQDTALHSNYLDSIRDTRAEAISKGATAGAKYANELLLNKENISNYANNQLAVAQQSVDNLADPLYQDAYARTTTRNYFDSLAMNLEDVINQLYYNDSVRFGQDWLNEATRYSAQQNLRGQVAGANANMYANYMANKAAVDAANNSKYAQANDYAFLYDNILLPKNNYNATKAYYDLVDYLQLNQTGRTGYQNLINNYTNK